MIGKITPIHLTDEEAKQLQKFCEENQCTQYSGLKTALRELLSSPVKEEETEETEQKEEITKSDLRKRVPAHG